MNTELIKPIVPMVPKYYYVVNTDAHPVRYAQYYQGSYFGQICSWHRSLSAAEKTKKLLAEHNVTTVAVYGADFVIRDSDFLSQLYGGAGPEWRSPVLMEEGK